MADYRLALWEVMEQDYEKSSGTFTNYNGEEELPGPDHSEFAAMIRTVRDWLPQPSEPAATASAEAFAIWEERKAVYALLTAEADHADRGEGANG